MSQHHLSQQPVVGQPDDVSHPAQSAGPQEANEVEGWIVVFLGVAAVKAVEVPFGLYCRNTRPVIRPAEDIANSTVETVMSCLGPRVTINEMSS